MAKKYHPDLNPNIPKETSEHIMSKLIDAHQILISEDESNQSIGNNKVALACEIYSLSDLKLDRFHDVHKLRILYHQTPPPDESNPISSKESSKTELKQLQIEPIFEIHAHPDDSVSDLRRNLQESFMEQFHLQDRCLDREQIAIGWEVVLPTPNCYDYDDQNIDEVDHDRLECRIGTRTSFKTDTSSSPPSSLTILSNHLFLWNYNIRHQDILYVIVNNTY
eukprot:CAMPEP_0184858628 /NCGR_PEP_ID=MMETSP0580-20130426/3716_1 /TAXON_ID=1118495 /ORGANISM="Dactyliosolen fragilissimus" /LENGTH=221 /DNA_ID=CAMNT_0027354879 /DNA_START=398 /DNA_END=1063 /DNA_ORIENTATION=-